MDQGSGPRGLGARPLPDHPRQDAFEARSVRQVLGHFGLAGHEAEMREGRYRDFGDRRLTFATFRAFFPRFPIVLEARSLYSVGKRLRPAQLFRSFGETFLMDR